MAIEVHPFDWRFCRQSHVGILRGGRRDENRGGASSVHAEFPSNIHAEN